MLEVGADPDLADRAGRTALWWAALRQCPGMKTPDDSLAADGLVAYPSVVDTLLQWGADVGARDERGRSALHLCAAGGRVGQIRRLLDGGAEPDIRDRDSITPLM